jgi:hypothetical protein
MNLVSATDIGGKELELRKIRHVFLEIDRTIFAEKVFKDQKIKYAEINSRLFALGDSAFDIAKRMNTTVKRPMKAGVMNYSETVGEIIFSVMIHSLIGAAREEGEVCCYSIPSDPFDAKFNVIYHKGIIADVLSSMGYTPLAFKEAQAVVYSELAPEQFTGIGISFGGGMINVSMNLQGRNLFDFASVRGGDWIDENVALALDIQQSRVTDQKETGVDLLDPKTRMDKAMVIYFKEVFSYLLRAISKRLILSLEKHPELEEGVTIVSAGGSVQSRGFIELFREEARHSRFPVRINDLRAGTDLLNTTAKGCFINAFTKYYLKEKNERR